MTVESAEVARPLASSVTEPVNAAQPTFQVLEEDQLQRGFVVLAVTTFAVTIAMTTSQAIQPNFMRDVIGMNGAQNGYLIAIRELPGFLLIFVAAFLLRLGLAKATAVSLMVMAIGYSLFALVQTFPQMIIPTLIASVGFHSWLQLQPALGLSISRPGQEGSTLGRINSIGFFGSMLALVGVLLLLTGVEHFKGDLAVYQGPYLRALFVVVGIFAVIGSVAIRRFPVNPSEAIAQRVAPKIIWRKQYRFYYGLSFLDGSRQQIYFAFAPFVLVEEFGVDAVQLTILLIISALVSWRTSPYIGKAIDRYGEKKVLTFAYSLHLVVFLGFALVTNIWLLYLCYVGYNWLFNFSIGTTTYLKKIAWPPDVPASLAMGVSLAHVTAFIVPVIGAAMWSRLGYQFPFLFGTVFVFLSLWLTQRINPTTQKIDPVEAGLIPAQPTA